MPEHKQTIHTQAEIEAVEISEAVTEMLLDKYPEYPSATVLAALLITVNSLMQAIENARKEIEKNDHSN